MPEPGLGPAAVSLFYRVPAPGQAVLRQAGAGARPEPPMGVLMILPIYAERQLTKPARLLK